MQLLKSNKGKSVRLASMLYFVLIGFSIRTNAQLIRKPDSSLKNNSIIQRQSVSIKSIILPATLITTGALGISGEFFISNPEIKEERDEHLINFHTSLDNYLQFAPIVAGYGMLMKNKDHSFWLYTERVIATEIIVTSAVQATKRITKVTRPDGSPYSFPSGHTAQAFAGATLFCDEFAKHDALLTATVYTGAAAIGAMRIANNRHWASDVIAGAGFGIASAKLSELIIHPRKIKPLLPADF